MLQTKSNLSKTFVRIVFILLFSYAAPLVADIELQLTKAEQAWIKANPQIKVANEIDWPPFDYVKNGQPAGYAIDVARLIAQKTGLGLKFINGYSWDELLQQFKAGKIDLLPALFVNDERRKYILFTRNYYSQPSVMVVHKNNNDISKIEHLENKHVAGVKGYSFTSAIQRIVPSATMVQVSSIHEGLKSVSLGKADAFVDSIGTVSYLLDNNFIPNLKIISEINHPQLDSPSIHMGVAKDNLILNSILNKALASISRKEKRKLADNWFHTAGKQSNSNQIKLSSEQQDWLTKHPKIRIGIMNAWPPMDYVDSNGKPQGIGVKFIEALNQRLGNQLEIVPGLWKENIKGVKEKTLDALMDITPRPDREEFVHFTKPYIEVPHLIYTRKGAPAVNALSDLAGKTVGIEKGFFIGKVLSEKYPTIKVKEFVNTGDALDALSKKVVGAYVGNRAVANYIIENELITNVIAQGKIKETSSVNAIGVRKDWPVLRDILQQVLDDISPEERKKIINIDPKENGLYDLKNELFNRLTKAERDWLDKKQVLRLGVDSAWPPIEWIDKQGQYQGMTSDYIKFISEITGLKFTKADAMPWVDVIKKSKKNELDVLPAVAVTPERQKYLNFTSTYLSFPLVIFSRDDDSFITDIHDLYGKRVGVENGYSSQSLLQQDHPEIELVNFDTTQNILSALSIGKIDAYVGNLTVAAYLIKKEGLTNIKVTAPTNYKFDLSMGIRKDRPELLSILNKTLLVMSEEQRNDIRQRWLKLNYKVGVDYDIVINASIITAIIIVLILFWVLFIQRQKEKLQFAKAETDAANAKLKELDQLKSMFIASVSHELRTPLNAVIGFSSVMMNGLYGELSEKYLDYTTRINKSGQHLLSLITDIIDISKIESGNLDIELEDFELVEVVDEAINNLQQLADSKGLKLTNKVKQKILLHTDKRRLFQTILNFVSNAVKYSEKGEVTVSAEDLGDSVVFNVKDTGVGISEDDMTRLFEPFERFESHISVKAGGTGLGLYLTNKIVTEMLKGEIGAESKPGKGSSFWVKFPKTLQ